MSIPAFMKIAGTWTPFAPLDEETEAVFSQAKSKLAGAAYTPFLERKQLGDETQYLNL
jgi:hypothetical protein